MNNIQPATTSADAEFLGGCLELEVAEVVVDPEVAWEAERRAKAAFERAAALNPCLVRRIREAGEHPVQRFSVGLGSTARPSRRNS